MAIITSNDAAIFRYLSDKRKDLMAEIQEVALDLKTGGNDRYLSFLSGKLGMLGDIIEDLCGLPRDTYGR
jgi:hypothetical protein